MFFLLLLGLASQIGLVLTTYLWVLLLRHHFFQRFCSSFWFFFFCCLSSFFLQCHILKFVEVSSGQCSGSLFCKGSFQNLSFLWTIFFQVVFIYFFISFLPAFPIKSFSQILPFFFKRNFFSSLLVRTFFPKSIPLFQRLPFWFWKLLPKFWAEILLHNMFSQKKSDQNLAEKKQKSDQNWSNLIKFDQNHYFDQIWSGLIRFDQIWSVLISFFSLDFFLFYSNFFWWNLSIATIFSSKNSLKKGNLWGGKVLSPYISSFKCPIFGDAKEINVQKIVNQIILYYFWCVFWISQR